MPLIIIDYRVYFSMCEKITKQRVFEGYGCGGLGLKLRGFLPHLLCCFAIFSCGTPEVTNKLLQVGIRILYDQHFSSVA